MRWRRWFRGVGWKRWCDRTMRRRKGRQPVGLSIMLRTYFVQQWFNLSDPAVEELLYESPAVRTFVGVDLGMAAAPDETNILRFRHLLEKHDLGGMMLDAVNLHLEARGIKIQTGTIMGGCKPFCVNDLFY
jgi:IS5 family transposase